MIVSSVQTTENGGYVAVIDGVSYALAPGGTDAYAQAVAAWIANGGVPTPYVPPTAQELLERLRDAARAILNAKHELGTILRAIVLETLEYDNDHRGKHNSLLQWLGSQGVFPVAQRQLLTPMQVAIATPAQARNAILTRAGEPEDD